MFWIAKKRGKKDITILPIAVFARKTKYPSLHNTSYRPAESKAGNEDGITSE